MQSKTASAFRKSSSVVYLKHGLTQRSYLGEEKKVNSYVFYLRRGAESNNERRTTSHDRVKEVKRMPFLTQTSIELHLRIFTNEHRK